jgi:hypothetical protein
MKDENIAKAEAVLRTCKLSGAELDFLERLLDDLARGAADLEVEEHKMVRLREILWNHGMY